MAKFKVLKPYKDLELNQNLKANAEVEMTVKRAEEVEKKISDAGFDGPFLKRQETKKK